MFTRSFTGKGGLFIFLAGVCLLFSSQKKPAAQRGAPLKVIFETDMGNDVDDALALDMLYKYMKEGKINLLAVSSNKNNIYSSLFISLMNNWYGYPHIPVGRVKDGADSEENPNNYARAAYRYTAKGGQKVFKAPDTTAAYKESVALYREVLSRQPDSSVVIISVGFSTNLARLLDSGPDSFSPLGGRDLVAAKVNLLSVMAGDFEEKRMAEYNVKIDVAAAKKVFGSWPGRIVTSPFELGNTILYPARSIRQDFTWTEHHPVVVAYESYLKMPYDRPTWDLTSVLYAVEGLKDYFSISRPGKIYADKEGFTFFDPAPQGNHFYLAADEEQRKKILQRFITLVTRNPKGR
ncbi:nucleoside hydrolase [Chitinophaga barathri]|uniref:Nucleoside hydrolase n=1 Tax=Chitinophaga barathri TaxID=1647451 RepID=A0A3N4MGQ9_9BACT|nr:nucleoside hydrolase [Chitinophaga barathri]RPD39280.1 nucleoside hydrolase [Chitinophaga barathri]